MHEAAQHSVNSFVTLTYDDENLPVDGSLRKSDFVAFAKRLRHRRGRLRYYHVGEYGKLGRPHYHAILFGCGFPDRRVWQTKGDFPWYRSSELEELWPYGFSTLGDVSFESAAYCARYCMKKVNGPAADHHYGRVSPSGRFYQVQKEYATMSRRPGIGRGWYDRFKGETYRDDEVISRGKQVRVPKYYDRLFLEEEPEAFEAIRAARMERAARRAHNETPARLEVRKKVLKAKLSLGKREVQ